MLLYDELNKMVDHLAALNKRELIDVLSHVFSASAKRCDGEEMNPDFGDQYSLVRKSFVAEESDEAYVQFLCVPSEVYLL